MHSFADENEDLVRAIIDYALMRLRLDPVPLGHPQTLEELTAQVGQTITAEGIGGGRALELFDAVLSNACVSVDHPRYLAFIPAAPTEAATMFDLVVGASSLYGGSWLEGSGAVYAENQALAWLARIAGFPEEARGVFMQGGTVGNLSALVAARHLAMERRSADGGRTPARWVVACSAEAHSSIDQAARVMDIDLLLVPVGEDGRLTGELLTDAVAAASPEVRAGLFAVVATAGTTNVGIIDDLSTVADAAAELGIWLHVDGAYGLAALAVPEVRPLFTGIERADSFITDPHKWLFAPMDACALLYRDPTAARRAHTQSAGYLDATMAPADFNPSDFGIHLSRRARGLPFWFSLATYGTDAYAEAVRSGIEIAVEAAAEIDYRDDLELVREPSLSIVLFRRRGWTREQYFAWSARLLADEVALVLPTTYRGETVLRFAFVNPRTTIDDVVLILDSLA